MLARILHFSVLFAITSVVLLFAADSGAITIDQVISPTNNRNQTVTGTMDLNTVVSVLCAGATVGMVSYPTAISWSVQISNLSEGSNTVTASADMGSPTSVSSVIVIDTAAPTLTVSTLENGTITNKPTLNVSGIATDGPGIGVASVLVNNNSANLSAVGNFSYALTLSAGVNKVTTLATDAAGNSTQDTRAVTLDQSAPQVSISSPADNIATSHSPTNLVGTVDENASVEFSVNGAAPQAAIMSGRNFTADAYLAQGINTIKITATDLATNSSDAKRTIIYDPFNPALQIQDPPQDIVTNQSSYLVKGSVSDTFSSVTVTLAIDGVVTSTPPVVSGEFQQQVVFSTNKCYQITAKATNAAGNETVVMRNIIYDNVAPVITSASSTTAAGLYGVGQSVNVTLAFSEPVFSTGLTILLNSGAIITSGALSGVSNYSGTFISANGQSTALLNVTTVSGTLTDSVGNGNTALSIPDGYNIENVVAITIDTTAPLVSAGSDQTCNALFTQRATASDATTLTYQWTQQSGPGTVIFGSPTALETTITASSDGVYVLRLTATDAVGNSSFGEMTLTWDTTAPSVNAGDNKTVRAQFTQTATVSDATTLTYQWTQQSGPGTVTFVSPTALETAITASSDGVYVLRLTAIDAADNSSFGEMTFTWDTTAPTVNAGGNKTVRAQFTQTATVSDATALTYQWTQQSGPGTVIFGSPTALETTITASSDGVYVLRLTATDAAGNSSFGDMTLTWDTTAPTVDAGGNKSANTQFTQMATANDATALTYQWTQQLGPGIITFGSPTALETTISASSDGTYKLSLVATDAAGNSASSEMTLAWDTVKPFISAGASSAHNAMYTQTASASDPLGMTFVWSYSGPGTIDFGSPTALSTAVTPDKEGVYALTITATDAAGNTASSEPELLTWDLTSPVMAISTLPNNTYTNEAVLPISGTVSDLLSGMQRFSINGVDVPLDANGVFNYSVTLAVGSNVITLVAIDQAGNTAYEVRTVILDPTAPSVTINSPVSEYKTNLPSVTITGKIDKECSIAIHVSGPGLDQSYSDVPVSGNIFTLENVGLAVGRNTIDVVVTSNANRQSTKSVTVTYDNEKPLLDVTTPAGDVRSTQDSIVISGTTSDSQTGVSVTITMDSVPYPAPVTNGTFSVKIPLTEKMVYIIAVTASDEAGNTSTVKRRVIFETPNGDINGDGHVDIADTLLALQVSVGMTPQLDNYLVKGDIGPLKNGLPAPDWKIDISDVVLILRIIVGSLRL